MPDTERRTRSNDHSREEDWVDFARGQGSPEDRARLQRHLESGCAPCAETVRLWKAVSSVAHHEASYAPPAEALRNVLGRFALHRPPTLKERFARTAELLFDSLREPAPAGVRAAGPIPRQLLYRAGPYMLKLRVENEPETERLSIVGQIVDEADPAAAVHDIGVLALRGSTMVDRTLTNRLGEFQLEPHAARDLYLSVGVPVVGPFVVQFGDPSGGRDKGGRRRADARRAE